MSHEATKNLYAKAAEQIYAKLRPNERIGLMQGTHVINPVDTFTGVHLLTVARTAGHGILAGSARTLAKLPSKHASGMKKALTGYTRTKRGALVKKSKSGKKVYKKK